MAAERKGEQLKVFISYSRREAAAAEALDEALLARGFDVTIDRRNLPFGEKWQAELAEFIRLSDTVVWLVSEASIQSKWVNWELDEVARRNKRLVPVMIAETARDALPRQLGEIHILPAEGVFDPPRDLDQLVRVLETDRAWLKEASRLQDRAHEWLSKSRTSALLLSRGALSDAERWKDRRPMKAPAPGQEVMDMLLASRQAATRRQRWWIGGSLAVALGAVVLAGYAFRQRAAAIAGEERAVAERNETLRSQSRFLAERAIGSLDDPDPERSMLLALEAMPSDLSNPDRPYVLEAEDAVRQSVIPLLSAKTRKELDRVRIPIGSILDEVEGSGESRAASEQPGATSPSPLGPVSIGPKLESSNRFSNDGRYLASSYADTTILETATGNSRGPFKVEGWALNPQFSDDSTHIFTRTGDNFARLWHVETGRLAMQVRGADTDEMNKVGKVLLSRDNTYLITIANTDRLLRVWGPNSRMVTEIEIQDSQVAAFSPTGRYFTASPKDGTFAIFETATGAVIWRWPQPKFRVNDFVFAPDETWIAIASEGPNVMLSSVAGEDLDRQMNGHSGAINSLTLSRDGKRLLTAYSDGTVRVWDVDQLSQIAEMKLDQGRISKLFFAANETRIVVVGSMKVSLWDAATGSFLRNLGGQLVDVDVSADGSKIAILEDRTIRVFNAFTGALLMSVPFLEGFRGKATFSVDGNHLLVAEQLTPLLKWPLYPQFDRLYQDARMEVSRCLSPKERKAAFLPAAPPTWCITGPNHKLASSPDAWEAKRPYDTGAWKQWLVEKRSGGNPPLPSTE